ncbi:MAG: hypothetical protein ACHP9Y_01290 [Gammaproteobacteria bacterium]
MSLFKYDYIKPEDLAPQSMLLTPGEAQYQVRRFHLADKYGDSLFTKAGDKILRLELMVTDSQNEKSIIFDNIISNPKFTWKLKQLLDSVGKPELYTKDGELDPNQLLNMQGRCKIKTNANPGYTPRSEIDRYLPWDGEIKGLVSFKKDDGTVDEDDDDSDLPF